MQPYYYKKHNSYLKKYGNKTIIICYGSPSWRVLKNVYYIKFLCGIDGFDFMDDMIKICNKYNIFYETIPYADSCGIFLDIIQYKNFILSANKEGYIIMLMNLCEYKKIHNISMIYKPQNNNLLMICDDENAVYI
jgi:hypothetical protein